MASRSLILMILLLSSLSAEHRLRPIYTYSDNTIYSTALFPSLKERFRLITIPKERKRHKVSAAELITMFSKHKVTVIKGRSRFITFVEKSPADLSSLKSKIAMLYKQHYPSIHIQAVTLIPRAYTTILPKDYTLSLKERDFRRNRGTLYIRTTTHAKKIFFDYHLDAKIDVIHTKQTLERKAELTRFNTLSRTVAFELLKEEPLTSLGSQHYRLKHKIKANRPIGVRDVESSPMVKRGKPLAVSIHSGGLLIEFAAVALEDGALHDIISIRKHDGQRLRAKVTGINRVEVE